MQRILRKSRQTGTLNLTSRELTHVPAEVLYPLKYLEADEKHWECVDLHKLDLSYNELHELPEAIQELAGLKWLKVKDNQLTRLPSTFGHLQQLVFLDLSGNRLSEAAEFIVNLTQLRELCLSSNEITTLPSNIGQLEYLETLRVDKNQLSGLPASIGQAKKLRVLAAQENQLTSLPESFAELSAMSTLDLSKNQLGDTLVVLDKMHQLQFVDLRNNHLTQFPSLPLVSQLDHLLLGNNKLTTIDEASFGRVVSTLTVLNIHNNQLSVLQANVMQQFQKLKTLDVSNNNLTDLPYVLGHLTTLNHIMVEGNPLRTIRFSVLTGGHQALKSFLRARGPAPSGPSMEFDEPEPEPRQSLMKQASKQQADESLIHAFEAGTLDLSKKQLARVPTIDVEHICSTLVHLNLSRNLLTELPASLGNLIALQTLTAEENMISKIHSNVGKLPRLQHLRLKRNRLNEESLTAMFNGAVLQMSMIKELDLKNNSFVRVPAVVVELPVLDTLLLSYNRLTNLENIDWSRATKLSVCSFSDNKLTSLGTLYEAVHLTSLSIENNNLLHLGALSAPSAVVPAAAPAPVAKSTSFRQNGPMRRTSPVRTENTSSFQRNVQLNQSSPTYQPAKRKLEITPPPAPVATTVAAAAAPAVDIEQLMSKILQLEVQIDDCSLSNAKRYAIKKELAKLRSMANEYKVGSIAASFGEKTTDKKVKVEVAEESSNSLASFFNTSQKLFAKKPEPKVIAPVIPVVKSSAPVKAEPEVKAPKVVVFDKEAPKKVKKPKHSKVKPEVKTEENAKEDEADDERAHRTIFVGNVSLDATVDDLKKFFSSCGKVESARLRSLPVAGCAVDQNGKQNLVKKVCANKKIFVEGRDNCNAYVVFASEESIEKALALNGSEFHEKFIRVDRKVMTKDPKRTVFVGNVAFTATEDEIRNHFEANIEKDDEDEGSNLVESVRIIRDKESHLGKGFCYVLLKDVPTATKALKLDGSKIGKRELRVSVCGKRFKSTNAEGKARSFEGRRAKPAPGAQMRVLKKRKLEGGSPPNAKRAKTDKKSTDKKPFKKSTEKKAGKANDNKKFVKGQKKDDKKFVKGDKKFAKKDKVPFEKPKKPKHAARKARQALEAQMAANAK
ncbi:hypothetical protein THRCLA_03115 [Thraustotheca clavata]|uniref:RRM domain-containing protein n=1 Tax=Thraustotheca clavata TaxID=74557 RepID=A0A1W0A320_9STRA|nr:hypothetical protein THRCLA_03115 [Thraustotheca clavata]